ncbi:hypothetical protein [Crocosphaera sp.]|uniref:hypothetical protein n=1 Tax=Crocosphaera sp. TaxID=2729996 RepID=UPI003F267B54|nr:hypothetical protein [Crocosphaera sp.]
MQPLKIRKFDDSLGVTLPQELLEKLNLSEEDNLNLYELAAVLYFMLTGENNVDQLINDSFPRLSDQENKLLEDLAATTNQTKKEVLRKALALINIAISSEEQGANLAIIKDGKVMTEITGFSTSAE